MKRMHLIVAAAFCVTVPMSASHADEPKVEVTVKNNFDGSIQVYAYDGDDAVCQVPRSEKSVGGHGETVTLRCRGNGKHRCKLGYKRDAYKAWDWCTKPAKDGATCTISPIAGSNTAKLDCDK